MSGRCPVGFTVSAYETTQDFAQWSSDMDALQKLGATSIRVGVSPWLSGTEHIAHVKRCLEDAKSRGLSVMLTCSQIVGNDESLNTSALMSEAVEYVGRMADELAHLVDWWQVANECDARDWRNWSRPLWDDSPGTPDEMRQREADRIYMDTEYLTTLRDVIQACSDRIKTVNPNVLILTTVTGVGANTDREYIWRRFYDVISPAVDCLGINLYPIVWWEKYVEMPTRLRRTSQRYNKPILISEIGLPAMSVDSEIEHGEWIAAQIDRASRSSDVDGVWVYQLKDAKPKSDPEYSTDAEYRFGVLNYDGTEKIYANSVRAMIKAVTS